MNPKPRNLPKRGPADLDTIAEAVRALLAPPRLLGTPVRRALLVNITDDTWTAVVTVIRFAPPFPPSPTLDNADIRLGGLRLVSELLPDSVFDSGTAIASALTALVAPPTSPTPTTPSTSIFREAGRNAWGPEPSWVIQHKVDAAWHPGLPQGPFVNLEHGIAFEDLGSAAVEWAGNAQFRQYTASDQAIQLIVPDRRAYFLDIQGTGETLGIQVESLETAEHLAGLSAVIAGEDVHGGTFQDVVRVEGGRAEVHFEKAMRAFRVYLVDQVGELYDRHTEHDYGVVAAESLFAPDRAKRKVQYAALDAAIASGENLTTEYKEWLPVKRGDPKRLELLECVCAFANAEGGTIWIGINDNGEIVGTDSSLRAEFGKDAQRLDGNLIRLGEIYVEALRNRVLRELRPRIIPEFEWVERDEHRVLALRVPQSRDEACYVEVSGKSYLRRGGTNRHASPPELALIAASRAVKLGDRLVPGRARGSR